ncbi:MULTISPECIES: hypothetical protein [Streptomyces]|uniref:hypothetical protein n=1 Tax=Streptomyces TaxID=1883 RepID=UPI0004C1BA16|nr:MULTISPECIES: hypothetical protein [unclassified Streptomyces]KOU12459.1 hypothetical protein ADK88_00775 [Streptomyces sp. NRRL F-2295]MBK0372405.1 hypothetical protein [Streptomyces sp. RB110-1]MBK0384878.1 hypothetical protein [Streptomyces sp. RB110-2]
MTKNAKIGAALVGGYLLGRTKKAKLALGFGMFLLGKKMDLDPRQIGRMLADSPVLGSLNDQVRKELVDATKTAATKALTQRAGSLADSLQQRTQALGSAPAADDEEPEEDDEPKKAARSSDRDEEADGDEKPKRAPRKTASSAAKSATASRSRSSSGSGRSSGGKSAAPARKRGSGTARKSTSSGARKARGGDDA